MKTIKVSQEYFIKHLVDELKKVRESIIEVDNVLYDKDDPTEWQKIRDSQLKLDDLIKAIEL